ncbi:hypothetical protein [Clostridium sp. ZS2-4]|uniref:hypothetical protein n=1 Tax=Clostridium sp. ZS2-4 TaxID=2987703 RepID=UPI00227AC65A|nr:hypothetical protein [Clostridium sp. ZS2-4]MCY6356190.1 hypothetical protein [Clostridium sp. ZS2-4]
MNKIKDIVIGLGISTFVLIVWAYKMLVTSDIPAEMFFSDGVLISSLLLLFFTVYVFYIRNTKFIILNIILLALPLFLWFMCMQQALTYHYDKYDTIVSIIGFATTLISFLQLIYWKVKNKI